MNINAILLDEKDNVVTCVREVSAGEEITYRTEHGTASLRAVQDIPYCHKVALHDLQANDMVIKYGEMIGRTNQPISTGCLVNEQNIFSVPRDYDSELV